MNDRKLLKLSLPVILSILVLLAALTAVTYAWFTFTTNTNVEPMSGTVSGGGVNLLISNNPNGPFEESCSLVFDDSTEALYPVSTSDLSHWYTPLRQNSKGVPTSYSVHDTLADYGISGRLWIRSEGSASTVYLHADRLFFGSDPQALAAMRLGLIVRTNAGTKTYIFRLDDMGDTSDAEAAWTITKKGSVYGYSAEFDEGDYTPDPAEDLGPYLASGTDKALAAGRRPLFTLQADETGRVEYFLYLEGCDENCINAVKAKDFSLQFGFAGLEN